MGRAPGVADPAGRAPRRAAAAPALGLFLAGLAAPCPAPVAAHPAPAPGAARLAPALGAAARLGPGPGVEAHPVL
jgi:hypothetical protein